MAIINPAQDPSKVLKTGDTMTGELDITYGFPNFKVKNTDGSQFAGAGFFLLNTTSSMANQAGVNFYMGINDASATQGFFAIDMTNTTGGGTGHLILFDLNANTVKFYNPMTIMGSLTLGTAGNKLNITTGSNASAGTGTLVAGTATISTTAVTASSLIFLTDTASSITNVGTLTISAKTAGTSFVVTSTLALDTSTFNWLIIN